MSVVMIAMACGVIAVLYGLITSQQVLKSSPGNEKMQEIAAAIQEGAQAYLGRQYTTIAIVGVVVAVILAVTLGRSSTVSFLIGAVLSGVAGYHRHEHLGARQRAHGGGRATGSLQGGLTLAFRAGAITGMLVAGLACSRSPGFLVSDRPWRPCAQRPHIVAR
jgi:K(+)-stimulated pyrophosphate-energized sodium pump